LHHVPHAPSHQTAYFQAHHSVGMHSGCGANTPSRHARVRAC
jgi:hypothetical protein